MKWFWALRARLQLLLAPRAAEARINEELTFHIDMETNRLMRVEGLPYEEARRRTVATFGGVQAHVQSLREGRGTAWFTGWSLDFKLGVRMLAKYPGLTIVGGLAMAFGIWFGAVTFQMFGILTNTSLPLPDGDRIVRIQVQDLKTQADEDRVLYDYQQYRDLRSITDLGAYRDASVNLVGADGHAQPQVAAAITASAFRIAPARPLHGRLLESADERAGAPPVVLLGYDAWQDRFEGDPAVVGRSVRLGSTFATVVGVMPEGYAFPMAHELWTPLRTDVAGVEPRRGVAINVFGRLAPGMSIQTAQAELTAIAQRIALEHPATHAELKPFVVPYAQTSLDNSELGMMTLTNIFIVALVTVVCSTVALLLFARAAARETEIIVRSALGASRRRIVTQLFAEALVLAGVSAVVGLATAQLALTRLGRPYLEMNLGRLPFWYDFNLSLTTVLYALMLAVLGAVIAGVMPARKITRGLGTSLRAGSAGGGGVSFGGVWTAVIVVQVALTVAFPAVVMLVRSEMNRIESYDMGFPAREYLGVEVGIEGPQEESLTDEARRALDARFSASVEALQRRLEVEPEIAGVTFVDRLPGDYHRERRVELEALPEVPSMVVATASVPPSYFDVLQAPVLSGRAFNSADLSPEARVVIVDQRFVELVMSGRSPIGHRVRVSAGRMLDSAASQLPWHEIVGVVKDLGMSYPVQRTRSAGLYFPMQPGSQGAMGMVVRGRGDPLQAELRIRELATAVDPGLRIEKVTRLDQATKPLLWFLGLWMRITIVLTAVALLLSLSGIYAVLSYTVARRTREIGVRVALGASARGVITSIFRRPLTRVVVGVAAGSALIALAAMGIQRTEQFSGTSARWLSLGESAMLVGYAILMLGVCLLACVVPTIRALRVQPTEALRAE